MVESATATAACPRSAAPDRPPVVRARASATVPARRAPPGIHGPRPSGRAGHGLDHLMRRYLLRRLAQAAIVVAGVVLLTFAVARIIPGDPATAYAGPRATKAELEQVRKEFGLDKPAIVQLGDYAGGIVTGDWGIALHTRRSVLGDLGRVVPPTLELVICAMLVALAAGIPLGLLAARRGGVADALARLFATLAVSAPVFMLALVLQWLFFQKLGVLPVAGEYDPKLDYSSPLTVYTHMTIVDALITGNWPIFTNALQHLILPCLAVSA